MTPGMPSSAPMHGQRQHPADEQGEHVRGMQPLPSPATSHAIQEHVEHCEPRDGYIEAAGKDSLGEHLMHQDGEEIKDDWGCPRQQQDCEPYKLDWCHEAAELERALIARQSLDTPDVARRLLIDALGALRRCPLLAANKKSPQTVDVQVASQLVSSFCNWAASHANVLQEMGPGTAASPLSSLAVTALQICECTMFSRSCLQELGSLEFRACGERLRGGVRAIAAVTHSLTLAWLEGPHEEPASVHHLASTVAEQLMHLSRISAHALLPGSCMEADESDTHNCATDPAPFPEEMRSLGTVNVAWGGLVKLLAGLPPCMQTSSPIGKVAGVAIKKCLEHLDAWLQHSVHSPYDANKTKVLRFWTMHLTRMLGTYVQHTAAAWPQLADLAVNVHAAIAQGVADERACADLELHVSPKLVQLMLMGLEEEAQLESSDDGRTVLAAIEAKVSLLSSALESATVAVTAGASSESNSDRQAEVLLLARVQTASAIMHASPLLGSSTALVPMATGLLPSAMRAAAVALYVGASGQLHANGGPHEWLSAAAVAIVSAAAAHCMVVSGDQVKPSATASMASTAWQEVMAQLHVMGVSAHPALQRIACSSLCCLVARQELDDAVYTLCDLGSAVRALAAAEASAAVMAVSGRPGVSEQQPTTFDVCSRAAADTTAASLSAGGQVTNDGGKQPATTYTSCWLGPGVNDSPACRAAQLLGALAAAAPPGAVEAAAAKLQLEAVHAADACGNAASAWAYALLTHALGMCVPAATVRTTVAAAEADAQGRVRQLSQCAVQILEGLLPQRPEGAPRVPILLEAAASQHAAAVVIALDVALGHVQHFGQLCEVSSATWQREHELLTTPQGFPKAERLPAEGTAAVALVAEVVAAWCLQHADHPQALQPPMPSHVIACVSLLANTAPVSGQSREQLMPMLLHLAWHPDWAVHAASIASQLTCADRRQPKVQQLFQSLLHSGNWAVTHEALLALTHASAAESADIPSALRTSDLRAIIRLMWEAPLQGASDTLNDVETCTLVALREYLERHLAAEDIAASLAHSALLMDAPRLASLAQISVTGGRASIVQAPGKHHHMGKPLDSPKAKSICTLFCCSDEQLACISTSFDAIDSWIGEAAKLAAAATAQSSTAGPLDGDDSKNVSVCASSSGALKSQTSKMQEALVDFDKRMCAFAARARAVLDLCRSSVVRSDGCKATGGA